MSSTGGGIVHNGIEIEQKDGTTVYINVPGHELQKIAELIKTDLPHVAAQIEAALAS